MRLDRQSVNLCIPEFPWYPTIQYLLRSMARGDSAWLFRAVEEVQQEPGLTDEERKACATRLEQSAGKPIIYVRSA